MGLNFKLGFLIGGVLSALLMGKPSPSSPMGRVWRWLEEGDPTATPKLWYFDIHGRGEAIRMAFHDQGVAFEDKSFTGDEWGKTSPTGLKAQWTKAGKLLFGQVPMLEVDGTSLVQTQSIMRFAARKYGWYDSYDSKTLTLIEMAADGVEDVRKQVMGVKYDDSLDADAKAAKYEAWCSDKDKGLTWLGYYESMAARAQARDAGATPFLAGTPSPTHADYLLFDFFAAVGGLTGAADSPAGRAWAALLKKLPQLAEWRRAMAARPALAAYLTSPNRRPA